GYRSRGWRRCCPAGRAFYQGLLRTKTGPANSGARGCEIPAQSSSGDDAGCQDSAARTMSERSHAFEFDWWLLTIVMAICLVGLLEIYSSTHGSALHGMQWKQLT